MYCYSPRNNCFANSLPLNYNHFSKICNLNIHVFAYFCVRLTAQIPNTGMCKRILIIKQTRHTNTSNLFLE